MPDLNDLTRLKEQSQNLQSAADRAQGALQTTMDRLESEFDCTSIEAAEALLETLEAREKKAKRGFDKACHEFEEEWQNAFEEEENLS